MCINFDIKVYNSIVFYIFNILNMKEHVWIGMDPV